ncbi:MAG: hypothetical protein K2X49_03480, partial [Acetobacteraceae bacterium]|nr:hypothetical protein [Acetobacteraceae bacterium]
FLLALRYRACCAFRRIGVRRLGLSGLALARRLTAGPGPVWHPPRCVLAALRSMHRICAGLARIRHDMEPA